jgi:hypothetical protein
MGVIIMADITFTSLAAKTSPAVTDEIPIWDLVAGEAKKATITNILNARLTGGGSIATGGFNLTLTGTSTLNGSVVGNMTGGGTVATGGFTLTVGGGSAITGTLSGGGTVATAGFTLTLSGTSTVNGSLVGSMTGSGTVATGGFTLTVPATGTAALLGTAQTFSALKTFSAGLTFGAETMSTYDEGDWTPTIAGSSVAGTQTYAVQVGRYIKIGKLVTAWCNVGLSAKDGTTAGNISIKGLPFPCANVTNLRSAGSVGTWISTATSFVNVTCRVQAALSEITLFGATAATASSASLVAADIGNSTSFTVSVTYEASS